MSWQRWSGIMKAVPFEEKRLAKWSPPYICQPKYDGDRCKSYPLKGGNYLCLTSEENPFFSIPHIRDSLAGSGLTHILDGELYSHHLNLEGGHELIHSIASRKTNLHPRHKELEYHIFDIEDERPQPLRLKALELIKDLNLPYIKVAPYWVCESLDEIKHVYDRLLKEGYEGIIIRHLLNSYERKRSTFIMKFKPKRSDTYNIVGWNEEISKDGIPKGRIGSLILSSQSGDTFAVSAGLNDQSRAQLWDIRGMLNGLSATVYYQHLTNKKVPTGCFDIKIPELNI
jgi:ATP-dependent DNA ligase